MPSRAKRGDSSASSSKAAETPAPEQEETYVSPSLARFYLTHLTATLIHYQGFTSCQAGVIAELERKVEDHIANIFGTARQLAEHCGRRDAQSGDIISALEVVRSESLPVPYPYEADGSIRDSTKQAQQEISGSRSRRERKARQRELLLSEDLIRFIQRDNRRRAQEPDGTPHGIPSLPLVTTRIPSTSAEPKTLSISDSEETSPPIGGSSAGSRPLRVAKKIRKLAYMLDVAPGLPDLPPRHTWKRSTSEPPREMLDVNGSSMPLDPNASRLSASALKYLAASLNPSRNIPTELTLVNYRTNPTSPSLPDPYPDPDSRHSNARIPGPLVQIDYTSSAMQTRLDERLSGSGYATDSRLSGPSRARQRDHRGPEGSEKRGKKMRFVIPGLHKRQNMPKVPAV